MRDPLEQKYKNIHDWYGAGSVMNRKGLIEGHFEDIMRLLGLNLEDDSLKNTPARVAKMFCNDVFCGLNPENFPRVMTVENKMKYNQMLIARDCNVKSFCEHHFVPFIGHAQVAYIPNKKVIGLSKINRIVDYYCRRPQVQERLTQQVMESLKIVLETDNVAVSITAKHYCVHMRGVEQTNSSTTTTALGGVFKQGEARQEFLNEVKHG